MTSFSGKKDRKENIGELILESLLNSDINSIINFNLSHNNSWFWHPKTKQIVSGNLDLLEQFVLKQGSLSKNITTNKQYFYLLKTNFEIGLGESDLHTNINTSTRLVFNDHSSRD